MSSYMALYMHTEFYVLIPSESTLKYMMDGQVKQTLVNCNCYRLIIFYSNLNYIKRRKKE